MTERLVVIGGDAAGMSAASQARRRRGPDDLAITVVEQGPYTSYSACGIPYWVAGDVASADDLVARPPEVFRTKYDMDLRMGHRATGIDLDAGRVEAVDADGRTHRLDFDQLMVATGAVPVRPDWPGIDLPGVYGVQTLADGAALHRALADDPRTAVVIGGGYIGLEMAEALLRRGLQVTLVEAADQVMSTVDADLAGRIGAVISDLGVTLRLGEPVQALAGEGRVRAVTTGSGSYDADLVVLGLGVRPNSGLARAAGLACGVTGGISTDAGMRSTSHERVWSAGDCVETHNRVSHRPVHVALGTHANKQGRVAGVNLGGGYATFPGVVGTAVTKVCELEIARTGLSVREVEAAGMRAVEVAVDSTTRAGYYPGAKPITTKIIAERLTGRLLGAQIMGREGAAKRIDVLATALWNEMTVEDMIGLDLSYAPPYAPVWDPVLIAARKAADAVAADR